MTPTRGPIALAVTLHVAVVLAFTPTSSAAPPGFRDCAACPEMVVIPRGKLPMGDAAQPAGATGACLLYTSRCV